MNARTVRHRSLSSILAATVLVLAACQAAAPSAQTSVADGSSPAIATTHSAVPSPTPRASVAVSIAPATPSPTPGTLLAIGHAATVVEGPLRVRSGPGVDADSQKLDPLLPAGTVLYVVDGPVAASSYDWYDVLPVTADGTTYPEGWVASAGRDGTPWVEPATIACPATPTTFAAMRRLSRGAALACFSAKPMTFVARVVPCNCEMDGPSIEPQWLGIPYVRDGIPILVDPTAAGPGDVGSAIVARTHPTTRLPDPLPKGAMTITGMFDHPDARTCAWTSPEDGGPTPPTVGCRTSFVITAIAD